MPFLNLASLTCKIETLYFSDSPWGLEMRVGIKSLELQGPTYIQEIWNFSTNNFTIKINLWWMMHLISFSWWEKDEVVCKKFLLYLNSLWVSPYANGKVAWDCLRWLCRPDLLKWEMKPHFKGLLRGRLFARAQARCPHAGRLRSWEGVVWFYETCCCQCRWRNATLWVYGSNSSVFCLPRTNSQLHAYLWTVMPKGEKMNSTRKLFSDFLSKYKWPCFQDIFLYIESCIPWHFTPLSTKALGMTVWLSEMGMEETHFNTDCWDTDLLNTSRSFESAKRV